MSWPIPAKNDVRAVCTVCAVCTVGTVDTVGTGLLLLAGRDAPVNGVTSCTDLNFMCLLHECRQCSGVFYRGARCLICTQANASLSYSLMYAHPSPLVRCPPDTYRHHGDTYHGLWRKFLRSVLVALHSAYPAGRSSPRTVSRGSTAASSPPTSAAQRRVLQLRPQLPEDICIWGRTYLTGGLAASPVTSRKVYTPYALYICGTETEDVQ
jgi:hypothetical protein